MVRRNKRGFVVDFLNFNILRIFVSLLVVVDDVAVVAVVTVAVVVAAVCGVWSKLYFDQIKQKFGLDILGHSHI